MNPEKKSIRGSLKETVKSLDIYGQQIMFTYKGDSTFKTLPGATATMFISSLLFIYFFIQTMTLINRNNPNVSKNNFQYDLSVEPPLDPSEYQYDMAFGLRDPLIPSIGSYLVQQINYYYSDELDA
jgi:hypothetical protein